MRRRVVVIPGSNEMAVTDEKGMHFLSASSAARENEKEDEKVATSATMVNRRIFILFEK